jgi:hypothetical protein
MLIVIVDDVEPNGRAGTVAVQHIVHAAFDVDDERHRDDYQIQFLAKVILNKALDREDRLLPLPPR